MRHTWLGLRRAIAVAAGVGSRFPLSTAASALGAAAGCVMVAPAGRRLCSSELALDLLLTFWMGVSLFLAAALRAESRPPRPAGARRWFAAWLGPWSLIAAGLLVACFVGLHGQREEWRVIRFILWMIAIHSLVAIAPVIPAASRPGPGDFRAFNVLLFTRTVFGLVLTHVLFAGLAFALMAIEKLFDVRIPRSTFGCLWFGLMGIVNTLYVLAGIPPNWDRLAEAAPPPRLLDLLARYILLPLSVLYLAILYVYSVKIIVVREWPRGWVSAPIIVFSGVGLLTVLLLGPDGDRGNRWVRAYCRGFFVALAPLVALLFTAIGRRTFEYGLTEERCLVFAIAVFLAIIAPYFLFSRVRKLASIPIALGAIALLTSVGPLSAPSLSLRSQTGRLRGLLERNHRLEQGRLTSNRGQVSARDEEQMSAVLRFLSEREQVKVVASWVGPGTGACAACASWTTALPSESDFMTALGMSYRSWSGDVDRKTTFHVAWQPKVVDTSGFDWLVDDLHCSNGHCGIGWGRSEEKAPAAWELTLGPHDLVIARNGKRLGDVPLDALVARLREAGLDEHSRGRLPQDRLLVEASWGRGACRLELTELVIEAAPEGPPAAARIAELTGRLLVKVDVSE